MECFIFKPSRVTTFIVKRYTLITGYTTHVEKALSGFKHSTCVWWLGNLKQDSASLQVSNLKAHKVYIINIVFRFTEVPCNNDRQMTEEL